MLKEKASIFYESHKELLGQNFPEDWCTNLKTKQNYQEVLRKVTKSTEIDCPFEGALQHHHMEEKKIIYQRRYSLLEHCHQHRGSIIRVIKSPYLNTVQLLDVDNSKVHPIRNLFHVKARQPPLAGRLKLFLRKMGKTNSRCEYFVHCAGFQNSLLPNSISVWSYPISKGEPSGKVTSNFEEMLKKGAIQQLKSEPGEFLSNCS